MKNFCELYNRIISESESKESKMSFCDFFLKVLCRLNDNKELILDYDEVGVFNKLLDKIEYDIEHLKKYIEPINSKFDVNSLSNEQVVDIFVGNLSSDELRKLGFKSDFRHDDYNPDLIVDSLKVSKGRAFVEMHFQSGHPGSSTESRSFEVEDFFDSEFNDIERFLYRLNFEGSWDPVSNCEEVYEEFKKLIFNKLVEKAKEKFSDFFNENGALFDKFSLKTNDDLFTTPQISEEYSDKVLNEIISFVKNKKSKELFRLNEFAQDRSQEEDEYYKSNNISWSLDEVKNILENALELLNNMQYNEDYDVFPRSKFEDFIDCEIKIAYHLSQVLKNFRYRIDEDGYIEDELDINGDLLEKASDNLEEATGI